MPMTDLDEAKAAFKRALAAGDAEGLAAAEKEIVRLRGIRLPDKRTFMHDSGNLIAWGEAEGVI